MQYKKYEGNSYNIYTVKTDRFKSCAISVVFRDNIEDTSILANLSILKSLLVKNNNTYKTRRELIIKEEDLYNASFYSGTNKIGNSFEFELGIEFINPIFVKEENYLEDIIKFNFDMIMNPKVKNDEFDSNDFNVVKERLIIASKRIHESGPKYSIKRAFYNMDPESLSSKYLEESDFEKVNPSRLYKIYKEILNNSLCDIYVIGDMDMDNVVSLIKKEFKLKKIKNHELNLYNENKKRKKIKITKENDEFVQANLVMGYNVDTLNEKEKIAMRYFVDILGGGMNSKLYQNLRVKNSLCYGVRPLYYKYDELLFIHVSFDESNYEKCVKLINDSISEIKKGKISDEEFERTKKTLQFSYKMSLDSPNSIITNYMFSNLNEVPLLPDLESKILEINKEDVINIAKKINPNFVYLLGKENN